MFPEFSDLMTELKSSDRHFLSMCNKHSELDRKVSSMVSRAEPGTQEEIETLKKKKLQLKDEMYNCLRKASAGAHASP